MWCPGYTRSELESVQARFNLTFPPDLAELYLTKRPEKGYDWLRDEEAIRNRLKWPLEGILFDVQQGIWWDHWGPQPTTMLDRESRVRQLVSEAPRLIPIYGHRFIPETPNKRGNPVFSVYQSDIVYYGADLEDYFQREFGSQSGREWPQIKRIPFWSDFAEA